MSKMIWVWMNSAPLWIFFSSRATRSMFGFATPPRKKRGASTSGTPDWKWPSSRIARSILIS